MLATKTINEAKEVLRHMVSFCLGARIHPPPVFLWGSTGIGKSDIVKQICDEEGIDFEDFQLLGLFLGLVTMAFSSLIPRHNTL